MIALMPAPANDRAGAPTPERTATPAPVVGPAPDLVRVALELPRLTVTRMAAELGIPRATLEAYRLGTRRMPAATRVRLAAYLNEHARMLRALADALRAS